MLPCRRIWAGVAAVWLVILALHLATGAPPKMAAGQMAASGQDVLMTLREQKEILAELTAPVAPSPVSPPPACPARCSRPARRTPAGHPVGLSFFMQNATTKPASRRRIPFEPLFRWFFTWRVLRRFVAGFAVLVTLVALFYAEEDWRGKRAWEKYKHEMEAKGAVLDWAAYIPPPVPDDQNIFKAPRMTEWFVGRGQMTSRSGWGDRTNGPGPTARRPGLKSAELTVVPPRMRPRGPARMCAAGRSRRPGPGGENDRNRGRPHGARGHFTLMHQATGPRSNPSRYLPAFEEWRKAEGRSSKMNVDFSSSKAMTAPLMLFPESEPA